MFVLLAVIKPKMNGNSEVNSFIAGVQEIERAKEV